MFIILIKIDEDYMMLLVILLLFSAALNIALIFGVVLKRSDEDMRIIRLREGLKVE